MRVHYFKKSNFRDKLSVTDRILFIDFRRKMNGDTSLKNDPSEA